VRLENKVGLAFTAVSDAAVAAFDRTIDEYLAFGRSIRGARVPSRSSVKM
jgi:hypothetical protein